MTPTGSMYVVGRGASTRTEGGAEEKPTVSAIIAQLTAVVADIEAEAQKARAQADADIAQLRRALNDVEASVATEREAAVSLRAQLAEAERLRLSSAGAYEEAVRTHKRLSDEADSRLRAACEERDTARASLAQRDEMITQLKAEYARDRHTSDAAVAELQRKLDQLRAEASRWSSIVHAVEEVLAPHSSTVAPPVASTVAEAETMPPSDPPPPVNVPDEGPAGPVDAYVTQLLGTAEQMYEMDRQTKRPALEILDRLLSHLRYARNLVVRRAAATDQGDAAFRRAVTKLCNERWDHEFGRTLSCAMYELYGNAANGEDRQHSKA